MNPLQKVIKLATDDLDDRLRTARDDDMPSLSDIVWNVAEAWGLPLPNIGLTWPLMAQEANITIIYALADVQQFPQLDATIRNVLWQHINERYPELVYTPKEETS